MIVILNVDKSEPLMGGAVRFGQIFDFYFFAFSMAGINIFFILYNPVFER